MSAYLGTAGRLVPIYTTPSMTVKPRQQYVTEVTLEGRVKAQSLAGTARREWALDASSADTQEVGALQAFAAGEWGRGPFVWVTPTAPLTNLLTPEQSLCDPSTLFTAGVTATGPLNLGVDGWAGRSFINPTPATTFYFGGQGAPVIPGQKVTASAYLVGAGAAVRIRWEDATGLQISTSTGTAGGVAGTAKRLSVTATAPANAALAQVQAINTAQGARPALTWTAELFPWGAGEGCPSSIVLESTQTMTHADSYVGGSRVSDLSFTVTEVG